MTKENEKILLEARMIAGLLVDEIKDLCVRIEVAGSIRRRRPVVHDIDIVLIPKPDCIDKIKGICLAHHPLFGNMPAPKWGERLASFWYEDQIQVDLYFADTHTFPIVLFIRTGSKDHNIRIMNLCGKQEKYLAADGSGMFADRLKIKQIRIDRESDIFTALGIEYLEPAEREIP